MIIPSIDLMDGQSVQLVGGKAESRSTDREYGDPIPLAKKFRLAGEIAVIDLDRALGKGSNEETILRLLRVARCRVGGGVRDVPTAVRFLDAGAASVILGTAAKPEILRQLPRKRVMAAVDAYDNEIVVEGWTKKTGVSILDKIRELRDLVGGFLVTFVEKEGRLGGTAMDRVKEIIEAAGDARVTFAGGITTAEEIAALDKLGADAQVGMAIYTGKLHLADAIGAPLITDRPDGLFATLVEDDQGTVLGLAYSSRESLRVAVDRQMGVYQSRKRGIWVKGETSGATQELVGIALDCDRDAIRFTVRQNGRGFCHLPQFTCFGDIRGFRNQLLHSDGSSSGSVAEAAAALATAGSREEATERAAQVLTAVAGILADHKIPFYEVEDAIDRQVGRVSAPTTGARR